jgi:hypothetical protein
MRVFLALHLPQLPLDVFRSRWSPGPAHRSAMLEKGTVAIVEGAANYPERVSSRDAKEEPRWFLRGLFG